MTSSFSIFTSILVYSVLQYFFKYQSDDEECNTSGKKSNVGSKVICLVGVVLFVYRFNRQPWRQTVQPHRMVFDVFSVLLAFEFLYSFLWLKVEFFFLEIFPALVNDILNYFELNSQIPEWPFIIPLYIISLLFFGFAQNSDIYIDYYLQPDDTSDESDHEVVNEAPSYVLNSLLPVQMSAGGFGEPMGRVGNMLQNRSCPRIHSPASVVPTRGRGTHTLTDAPIRRSERLQNRSNPDMEY